MTAFAANSVLARFALDGESIDAGSYSLIRLLSAVVALVLLVRRRPAAADTQRLHPRSRWSSAVFLFAYVVGFSYAYVSLGAAVGALVLFGVVQLTVFGIALLRGERPGVATWLGLLAAVVGLLYLLAPGIAADSQTIDSAGVALMAAAGVAWGLYTLRGRGARDPVRATADAFVRASLLGLPLLAMLIVFDAIVIHPAGVVLAVISGAVASGLGYVVWYSVLPSLTRSQSGVIQLSPVPLAALGGLIVIGEPLRVSFVVASALVLGGVAAAVLDPARSGPES